MDKFERKGGFPQVIGAIVVAIYQLFVQKMIREIITTGKGFIITLEYWCNFGQFQLRRVNPNLTEVLNVSEITGL